MATTNYSWTLPTVGASFDTWGGVLNDAFEAVDASVKAVEDKADARMPRAGGAFSGTISGPRAEFPVLVGALTGNASTATRATTADRLTTARTIAISGAVSGSASFSGAGNVTISVSFGSISIGNVSGLSDELNVRMRAPVAGATIRRSTSAPSGGNNGDIWLRYS